MWNTQENRFMRTFLFFILFVPSAFVLAQDEENLTWLTNLEEAQKIAKKEKKNILLYFNGSDWCAPCKMLKEDFFNSEEFQQKAENLVLVMIDYPRRIDIISEAQMEYNKQIMEKYNQEKTFPKLLALNYKGKELAYISGYSPLRDTTHHFHFIDKILQ